jgi:hypothetical protein
LEADKAGGEEAMMRYVRNRATLHRVDFEAFKAFAQTKGYASEPTRGAHEVIRLRRGGEAPLLFHKRAKSDHATTQTADALLLVHAFIRRKREARRG